ncbi:hypothetical protein [Flavobacterium reichenbachii]|uniref:Transglutaminase-like domain-containing protein n=1 Tax=Flavobacterium reichenbachii TaxID=362418 RepID=A0A085ZIE7_9FLAO|nr:hypothetical protein [Flavobacterium reichenbachii]KFF04211.1 hypothetical protein IW19_01140 [Flavobacterium reichenbachii]OXB13889.1 hypothetical protein B0A68_14165 [Flavobacterium reichenbachii]
MLDKTINIINEETFVGEDNLTYKKVTYEIKTPRKTYLKGVISGKYRGIKIEDDFADLFDFEIYEANVISESRDDFRADKPFVFATDFESVFKRKKIKGEKFPKEKLPQDLPVLIIANEKSFGVNVLEPQLFEFEIIRKLHQIEGDEIFGSFNAYITGYIIDYTTEIKEEIILVESEETLQPEPIVTCLASSIETGKIETRNNYIRREYKCKNHKDNVWGNWEYENKGSNSNFYSNTNTGCFNQVFGILGVLLGLAFLIFLLPGILYIIAYFSIILILGYLGPHLKLVFRIIGILFLLGFIASLINSFNQQSHTYNPKPLIVDSPREISPIIEPVKDIVTDNTENTENDSILTRYRSWKDYAGNKYEGKYQIKLSDYKKAHLFKTSIKTDQNSINEYDRIIFNLKEFDKDKIPSIYKLFDSIGNAKKLDKIKFAEMIVSFVQDIPYALVLDKECNASLYSDQFTKNYLLSNKGDCSGNQRFGINTPVEFLVNLKGDCDTRTLLLYSILNHYNYDVAIMSSEFYGHSVIGINLPITGITYIYDNQHYVLWETTVPNAKPGNIPNEISNLNNWRISLKSK